MEVINMLIDVNNRCLRMTHAEKKTRLIFLIKTLEVNKAITMLEEIEVDCLVELMRK